MAWELNSDRPIYTQILEKIKTLIVCGVYNPGDKLPSVRDLAAQVGVNPNTMQRAFAELERSELIITQRNSGRVVTSDENLINAIKKEMAQMQVNDFIENMKQIGFTNNEIISIINETLREGTNIE